MLPLYLVLRILSFAFPFLPHTHAHYMLVPLSESPLVGHVLRSVTFTLCTDIPKQLPVQLPFLDGSFEVQI